MEKFNIAVVGHIDHGKSTLIGRLLYDTKTLAQERIDEITSTCKALGREFEFAYILDAFWEEQQKEMTIDTTQVFFKTPNREYIIIDTPGHKELLKNMASGASYAEAAVLIVSVKEGIQEQTKRHAHILKLFGIKQIIVVVNKMDEVAYSNVRFESLKAEFDVLFKEFGIEYIRIIPISAKNGDNIISLSKNMPWYQKETLLEVLDGCRKISIQYDFRMPVQDVYHIDDENIIAGRICSGQIKESDEVTILPLNQKAEIKSIRIFEGEKDKAFSGESVGFVFKNGCILKRGDILSRGISPKVATNFLALILGLKERLVLDDGYILQCVTQQVNCRIKKIEEQIDIDTLRSIPADYLNETDIGRVEIVTDAPLVYEEFEKFPELGRFVLRKNNDIIGAGIIV